MKIETKFDVNNLVVSKYQRNSLTQDPKKDFVCCFEVIDIKTGTCMAGTQVFYECRSIHGMVDTDYIDGKRVSTYKDFTIGSNHRGEYISFREDEIVEAPKELIDLVLGSN